MKRLVFMLGVALLLTLAFSALVVVLTPDTTVEADSPGTVQRLQTKLEARGFTVGSIRIDGDRVTIDRIPVDRYGINDEVAKWAAYRTAAEEGFSWLELGTVGAEPIEGFSLRLLDVRHADAVKASAAVATWVAEVEANTGVKAKASYTDYRLDLVVEGPLEAAPAAAEQFMMGGVVQHESGVLDILTIVIGSDGTTVFEGVCDYVVGVQARLYQAPGVAFDW